MKEELLFLAAGLSSVTLGFLLENTALQYTAATNIYRNLLVPDVLFNIMFLGLAASSLGFVMWNTAINLIGVVKAGNYIYLTPLITMITAVIILHEKITMLAILGALLIMTGVYISEHGLIRRKQNKG